MQRRTARLAGEIFLCVLLASGCVRHEPVADLPQRRAATEANEVSVPPAVGRKPEVPAAPASAVVSGDAPVSEDILAVLAERGRTTSECFQLRPGGRGEKASRCEPQSLPFARCRSGIDSCRLGRENGPLTWFACEKERGNTSLVPRPGSILILAANNRRKMPTGHVAYVEEAVALSGTTYRLVFTHTNYDRRCSLESNIEATYDRAALTLDIHGGAWGAWGKGLPVAGFILD